MPGEGWWQASDGRWYPPETHPDAAARRSRGNVDGHLLRDDAGRSAGAQGDKLRDRAADLRAQAERLDRRAENWEKGAAGERTTAERLALLPSEFVVMHDLHVPGSRANVDHLVIGPTGVFVVDSKAHSGTFREGSGTLWNGKRPIRREVETLGFISTAVAGHLDVVTMPIMCFTQAKLPAARVPIDNVMVVSLDALLDVITNQQVVYTPQWVEWLPVWLPSFTTRCRARDVPGTRALYPRVDPFPPRYRRRPTRTMPLNLPCPASEAA